MVERRVCSAADLRDELPAIFLPALLTRALKQKLPLLEAQTRRAVGLAKRDPSELSAAIAIWERIGSPPNLGPARAERCLLAGDQAETNEGRPILKKIHDLNYSDRVADRI